MNECSALIQGRACIPSSAIVHRPRVATSMQAAMQAVTAGRSRWDCWVQSWAAGSLPLAGGGGRRATRRQQGARKWAAQPKLEGAGASERRHSEIGGERQGRLEVIVQREAKGGGGDHLQGRRRRGGAAWWGCVAAAQAARRRHADNNNWQSWQPWQRTHTPVPERRQGACTGKRHPSLMCSIKCTAPKTRPCPHHQERSQGKGARALAFM